MAVNLGQDSQIVVKKPDVQAVQFGTFDDHADAGFTADEALLRDQGLFDRRCFVGHSPDPDTEPLATDAPRRGEVRLHVNDRLTRHAEAFDSGESAYFGSAVGSAMKPCTCTCTT